MPIKSIIKTLLLAFLAISNLALMVGCQKRTPIAEIQPPGIAGGSDQPVWVAGSTAAVTVSVPKRERLYSKPAVIHDATIPMTCVSDINQDDSDCRVTANPTIARCNNMLVRFACLSYRNQTKTLEKSVPEKK